MLLLGSDRRLTLQSLIERMQRLGDRQTKLSEAADRAYATGAHDKAARLEALVAEIGARLQEMEAELVMFEREDTPGDGTEAPASLEDNLRAAYWHGFVERDWKEADAIGNMRAALEETQFAGMMPQALRKDLTDEEIVTAARDVYERYQALRKRYQRPTMGILSTRTYSACKIVLEHLSTDSVVRDDMTGEFVHLAFSVAGALVLPMIVGKPQRGTLPEFAEYFAQEAVRYQAKHECAEGLTREGLVEFLLGPMLKAGIPGAPRARPWIEFILKEVFGSL